MVGQGAKLRKVTGFPFEKPPVKGGFPQLFRAFRKHAKSLAQVFAFQGLGFRQCFWVSRKARKPVISHPAQVGGKI